MGFWDWMTGKSSTTMAVASPWSDNSHLEHVTLAHLFPSIEEDDLPITRDLAMSVPAIARARNLIAPGIGRMPLLAHTRAGLKKSQPAIVRQPDPEMPALTTFTWAVDEMLFYGAAWFYELDADAQGRTTRARILPTTGIMFDNDRNPYGYRGRQMSGKWIRVDGPHEGILSFGRTSIRAALAIERAYRRAANMPVPAIDLHQTSGAQLSPTERQELIQSWVVARNSKNGAVGYTSKEIEAKVLGQPVETLLIAARNAAALDCARLTSVPAWAVDASTEGSSLTYSNLVDRNRELMDYGQAPYMAAIEARFSMDDILARGTWSRFSTDDWLRGDLKARAEAYKAAQEAGLMTPEESKTAERGTPVEG